jgi:hypothetical protein
MHSSTQIPDADLHASEAIHTRDPSDPNAAGHQLWGHQSAESKPNDTANVVEISLPSDDHEALLQLIARIERIKGKLPPDVAVLRRNLSG